MPPFDTFTSLRYNANKMNNSYFFKTLISVHLRGTQYSTLHITRKTACSGFFLINFVFRRTKKKSKTQKAETKYFEVGVIILQMEEEK